MNYNTNPPAPQLQTAQATAQQAMRPPQMPPVSGGVNAILGTWKQQRQAMLNPNPAIDDANAQMYAQKPYQADPAQQYASKPLSNFGMDPVEPSPYMTDPMEPSPGEITPIRAQTDAWSGAMQGQNPMGVDLANAQRAFQNPQLQQAQGFAPNPNNRQMSGFGPPNSDPAQIRTDPYARMAQNPRVMALMQALRQRQGAAGNFGGGDIGLPPLSGM